MPLDNRWYTHPKNCKCPECMYHHDKKIAGRVARNLRRKPTDSEDSSHYSEREGTQMKKAFLILLVIVCLAVVVWTAYLLFTEQTDPIVGGIILAVNIGVLFWNISVLRAHGTGAGSVVALFLVIAGIAVVVSIFAGVGPLAGIGNWAKDGLPGIPSKYDVEVLPGQSRAVDNWFISLNGGGWNGGTLTIEISITNLGSRRMFGVADIFGGERFAAIDSTDKIVEPKLQGGESPYFVLYNKEFYPDEKWTGTLVFAMSPYSGATNIYLTRWNHNTRYFLFDVGEPVQAVDATNSHTPLKNAIVGTWRHGLPETCPPSMDSRLYEELKELPENETYYLEFADSGEVSFLGDENTIINGTYRFISDRYVQLNWAVSLVPTAQRFFSQHGVYEIQFSEEIMYLTNEYQIEASYRQVS